MRNRTTVGNETSTTRLDPKISRPNVDWVTVAQTEVVEVSHGEANSQWKIRSICREQGPHITTDFKIHCAVKYAVNEAGSGLKEIEGGANRQGLKLNHP